MPKKTWNVLLLCIEIGVFLLLSPIAFWKAYLAIGPVECYVLGHYTYVIFSIGILALAIAASAVIIKSRLVKIWSIKVIIVWTILTLAVSAITCLFAPFIIAGAF
jgi:hypothetical protein